MSKTAFPRVWQWVPTNSETVSVFLHLGSSLGQTGFLTWQREQVLLCKPLLVYVCRLSHWTSHEAKSELTGEGNTQGHGYHEA